MRHFSNFMGVQNREEKVENFLKFWTTFLRTKSGWKFLDVYKFPTLQKGHFFRGKTRKIGKKRRTLTVFLQFLRKSNSKLKNWYFTFVYIYNWQNKTSFFEKTSRLKIVKKIEDAPSRFSYNFSLKKGLFDNFFGIFRTSINTEFHRHFLENCWRKICS